MPEVWFPYGGVETLVTIQAENLGSIIEPVADGGSGETSRLAELVNQPTSIFACDTNPSTIELLRMLVGFQPSESLKIMATETKRFEASIQEIKGRVQHLPRLPYSENERVSLSSVLREPGHKLFIGTGRPDPLFGIMDSRIEAPLNWADGGLRAASRARNDFEPNPFQKTSSYETADQIAANIADATFLTAVPRGGKVRSVLENPPFEAVRDAFLETSLQPTRGLVAGPGGRGYDDTFSSALRSIWGVLAGVKKGGDLLLVAECSEGMGSSALDLLVMGRIGGDGGKRREKYVPGIEEVYYLSKLKEEYSVLLLSGLPEIFAKNKLGLSTAKGSGEAVGKLLNKLGRTAKMNVITRAAECRVQSA